MVENRNTMIKQVFEELKTIKAAYIEEVNSKDKEIAQLNEQVKEALHKSESMTVKTSECINGEREGNIAKHVPKKRKKNNSVQLRRSKRIQLKNLRRSPRLIAEKNKNY